MVIGFKGKQWWRFPIDFYHMARKHVGGSAIWDWKRLTRFLEKPNHKETTTAINDSTKKSRLFVCTNKRDDYMWLLAAL